MNDETISDGPVPKHRQVRDRIVELASPGQAIPSERELMTRLGVSRGTIRKAIDGLVSDGLLVRSLRPLTQQIEQEFQGPVGSPVGDGGEPTESGDVAHRSGFGELNPTHAGRKVMGRQLGQDRHPDFSRNESHCRVMVLGLDGVPDGETRGLAG